MNAQEPIYGFDPAYGLDLDDLLAVQAPAPPAGFADFWRARHAAARALHPAPELAPCDVRVPGYTVQALTYTSTGAALIHGWLLTPEQGEVTRGLVIGHGYGGRDGPEPPPDLPGAAVLYPCLRGLGCSPLPGVSSNPFFHVLHDIQDRDRYILGGCVDDLWLAVSALQALFPAAGCIACLGISFSGGIAALAAPWDARIRRLFLEVPSFGHQPLRLELPSTGSNEAVRRYVRQRGGNVLETLAYYDAAVAARYLDIPVLIAAAKSDPVVPPPGQFAIANAIPEPWRRLFPLTAGHGEYPDVAAEHARLDLALTQFLRED